METPKDSKINTVLSNGILIINKSLDDLKENSDQLFDAWEGVMNLIEEMKPLHYLGKDVHTKTLEDLHEVLKSLSEVVLKIQKNQRRK